MASDADSLMEQSSMETDEPDALGEDAAHILIIDDDRSIRQLLKKYLSVNGYRVTVAESAGQARARMKGLAFDLLVLDVMMPEETGMEFARSLRGDDCEVPILMLTALTDTDNRIEGLESGADDYLPKPFEPRELLLRIRNILRRGQVQPIPALEEIRMGGSLFLPLRGELKCNGEMVRLTAREKEILQIFAASPGKTFSRFELSENDGSGRERSVDVLINRLRRKIEPDPAVPVYLQTIRGAGYALFTD